MQTRAAITMKRAGTLVTLLAGALPLCAQMHRVEKPERVTRSIGVYEWTGELKKPDSARLIPLTLFINSHFEDGDLYLARPVPFTLETGDEYSIERAGQSLGLFDVEYARDVVSRSSVADDNLVGAWYGYGRFAVPASPKKSTLTASVVQPSVVDGGDDDAPHLAVRAGAEDDNTTAKSDSNTTKSNSGGTAPKPTTRSAPANPAPDDDPDRPTLRHRDPKPETGRAKKQKDSGSVIPLSTSLNDDPDRPSLRRGVPAEQLVPKQLTGLPPSLHQAVAVSDASSGEPHVFAREWESSAERAETLRGMEALAGPMVAIYLASNNLVPAAASAATPSPSSGPSFATKPVTTKPATIKPAPSAAAKHGATKKPQPPVATPVALANEELRGYELSYGGLPTFVFSAEQPLVAEGPVYVTLVAQRLPSGDLQVALSSVTDATHLNRVPWMRPVDVVDPDGGHRASLLMELRGQSSRQFALYRLVTAKAEQQFVTGTLE